MYPEKGCDGRAFFTRLSIEKMSFPPDKGSRVQALHLCEGRVDEAGNIVPVLCVQKWSDITIFICSTEWQPQLTPGGCGARMCGAAIRLSVGSLRSS